MDSEIQTIESKHNNALEVARKNQLNAIARASKWRAAVLA
jgi:hypothetical protein